MIELKCFKNQLNYFNIYNLVIITIVLSNTIIIIYYHLFTI